MNKPPVRKWIIDVLTSGNRASDDIETGRKVILFNAIGLIAVAILVPLGTMALVDGRRVLAILDLTLAAQLAVVICALRKIGYRAVFSHVTVVLSGVLFVYLLATGGVNQTGHLWFNAYPLVASFLLGARKGLIAAGVMFGSAVVIFAFAGASSVLTPHSPSFALRFLLSYVLVSAIAYSFDSIRAKTQQELAGKNAELEAIVADIRQAKDGQRETSALLETILNGIPDIIGIQDRHHGVIRYNAAGHRFFGLSPEQVRGKKCYELIGCSRPCDVCATTESYRTKKPAAVEKYYSRKGLWLDVRTYPILDEQGEIQFIVEHLRDITKEKEAERALQHSEERYRSLVENTMDGYFICRIPTGRFIFLNQRACDLYGYTREEGLELSVWEVMAAEDHERIRRRIRDRLAGNRIDTELQTYTARRKDGSTFRAEISTSRVTVNGEPAVQGVLRDVTEIERLQRQLQQAQKFEAIGTLAGGIAHDFNNLLMGIQGRSSLIAVGMDPSDPLREHPAAIEEYVQSATHLTRQLLGFARGGKYEVTPIDLNDLVASGTEMFGRTRKEIQIRVKTHSRPLVVEVDRGQIEQALLNVLLNAWQAMAGGGRILIETRPVTLVDAYCSPRGVSPGPFAMLSVTDTGIGMETTTLQRIFEPFFTTKSKSRGSGLGLASTYGIVKNHGGIITVDSELGRGTTFVIYLPASGKTIRPSAPVKDGLIEGAETILLIDDEEMIRDVGRFMLEKLGYRVWVASEGREAVEIFTRRGAEIDLVILDLIMPAMDGGKTFDRIRELDPAQPVLLSSGYAIDGQATEIMARGCNGFIQKPFNLSEISRKVRQVLERTQPGTRG